MLVFNNSGIRILPGIRWQHLAMNCIGACLLTVAGGCDSPSAPVARVDSDSQRQAEIQMTAFCADCHAMPPVNSFPKESWEKEVRMGFRLYELSERNDLKVPDVNYTINWFRNRAPEDLAFDAPPDHFPGNFRRTSTAWTGSTKLAAVSYLNSFDTDKKSFFVCDMFSGVVSRFSPDANGIGVEEICKVANPCHIELTDLDNDEQADYVIADLGSINSADHLRGALWWVRQHEPQKKHRILKSIGRIADVRPIDFDRDGDQDLLVGEFGLFRTGGIHLLKNIGVEDGIPQFEQQTLDDRAGTIHLPVCDLNEDGWADFVALISQEHEIVVAFLNDGNGGFEKQTIFAAQDPAYGSCGIDLADLDKDGDIDVLYANGDTTDLVKPYQGVFWLENRGTFPFTTHTLIKIPGVHRARPADLDGDGDLDIVTVASLPFGQESYPKDREPVSVAWLEQTAPSKFALRIVETGKVQFATCELFDWDSDGDTDILTAAYSYKGDIPNELVVFLNEVNTRPVVEK